VKGGTVLNALLHNMPRRQKNPAPHKETSSEFAPIEKRATIRSWFDLHDRKHRERMARRYALIE
jgi:hypothetical protein